MSKMVIIYYRDLLSRIGEAIYNKYVRALARLIMLEHMVYDDDLSYYQFAKSNVANEDLISRIHPGMGSYVTERLLAYTIARIVMPNIEWDITTDNEYIYIMGMSEATEYVIVQAPPVAYRIQGTPIPSRPSGRTLPICDVRTLIDLDTTSHNRRLHSERTSRGTEEMNFYVPLYRENMLRRMAGNEYRLIVDAMLKPNSNILRIWNSTNEKNPLLLFGVLNHKRYFLYNMVIEALKPDACQMSTLQEIYVPRLNMPFKHDIDIFFQ